MLPPNICVQHQLTYMAVYKDVDVIDFMIKVYCEKQVFLCVNLMSLVYNVGILNAIGYFFLLILFLNQNPIKSTFFVDLIGFWFFYLNSN